MADGTREGPAPRVLRKSTYGFLHVPGLHQGQAIGGTHRRAIGMPPRATVPADGRRRYEVSKRLLDILLATVLGIVALPVLAVLSAVIKLTSRGPVLYRQRRLGRHGDPFWCWKFRTMVPDADAILNSRPDLQAEFTKAYKLDDDPRVTAVGRVLRKLSLDELPQIVNILRGDMSFIGPRPIVPPELEKYGDCAAKFLSVPPGLSGFWQVFGRSDTAYRERIEMDMTYIDHRSLSLDLRLMFLTISAVLSRRGAR